MIIKIYLSFGVYVFLFLYIIVCLMVGQNDVKVSNPPPRLSYATPTWVQYSGVIMSALVIVFLILTVRGTSVMGDRN